MTDASASSGKTSSFGFRDVDAKEKVQLVRGVFDSVASSYDLMNDLMSGGVHRLWKDAAAAKLNPRPGETILDVAGGTGDMARRYAKMARAAQQRRGGEDASVIVLDYNAEMIMAGVHKGGEPVIGKAASQVSMGRLLGQLFEITALFDMHLRPELILLQKTMVSVEGVARRLNPDHDLWAASHSVVERWIRRELGPQAQVRDALEELRDTLKALSRLARNPPEARTVVVQPARTPAWVIAAVTVAVCASAAALVLSLWPAIV